MKRYWFYTITSFVIRFKTSPLSSHFNIHPSSGKCTLFFIAEPLFNFIVLRHTRKAYKPSEKRANCKRKIWDVLIPSTCLTFSANNNIQIIKVTRWEIVKNQNKRRRHSTPQWESSKTSNEGEKKKFEDDGKVQQSANFLKKRKKIRGKSF